MSYPVVAKLPNLPAIAPYIDTCRPYPPGKPIEELERELGIKDSIKLASNENPLGPSPLVLEELQKAGKDICRLYPDANHYFLREALSQYLAVSMEELIIGNGSNEIIDLLVRTYCLPDDNIVTCANAFVAYRVCANIHGTEYREPASEADLRINVQAMLDHCDKQTKLMFLPNPNNPTGAHLNKNELTYLARELKEKQILLVLDYAYFEYGRDLPDPLELYQQFSNIVILRTFSKAYGLAGLRIGYGIAHPNILAPMRKVKMPFNVTNQALLAAKVALQDQKHVQRAVELNQEGMAYLRPELQNRGIKVFSSQGNFLLVELKHNPQIVYDKLLREGVIVRPVANYGLTKHLRISVGTMAENERFIGALDRVLG